MAIVLKNKNFAKSTLAVGIAPADLSFTVASGEGIRFPQVGTFIVVLWGLSFGNPSDDPNREVLHATLLSGDVFTIIRAQEGTSAKSWGVGDKIAHTITAGKVQELEDEINQKQSKLIWDSAYAAYLIN